MKPARNRSTLSLILCNVLGVHNKKGLSRTGAVHYCGRCGIVTRDDRRQGMAIADAARFAPGMKITFGAPGQEYLGTVAAVDYIENRIVLSRIEAISKWRSWLSRVGDSITITRIFLGIR
jgi:hypothetical protein